MDIRYTFIGAANCFGFVVDACETVMHQCVEKQELPPVDADRFVEYVRDKLCPVLGNYANEEPNSVAFMDNCSIHLDPRVRQLIEATGAIIVFSAPYCPELIPIEYMFHQWKAFLKRYELEFKVNWYEIHTLAILSITPQQGLEYFKKTTLTDLVISHPLSYEGIRRNEETLAFLLLICAMVN